LGNTPLILGGTGQVGSAMSELLPRAIVPPRSELDLSNLSSLPTTLKQLDPSAIINCAAWTAVDAAEDNEELATTVNAYAVERLATYCAKHGLPFLTFSTDYVFDGETSTPYVESFPTSPINAYGRSKALGENLALAAHPQALVVRSSWVVSATHESFLSRILARATGGATVRVVDDQRGRPTAADDLALAGLIALAAGTAGLLHVANAGDATWFELAREAVDAAGLDGSIIVQPCSSDDYPTRAIRPRYSVLGTERAKDQPPLLPPWKATVRRLVPAILGWPQWEH
jgi:dTDP-4-dehydrorhamnose reductase